MFVFRQFEFNSEKEIRNSLQALYGVGWHKSMLICSKIGLGYPFNCGFLNEYQWDMICYLLEHYTWLEVQLKRIILQNVRTYYEIQTYKGLRYKDNLPVRGQRTRSNCKTCKRVRIDLNG